MNEHIIWIIHENGTIERNPISKFYQLATQACSSDESQDVSIENLYQLAMKIGVQN